MAPGADAAALRPQVLLVEDDAALARALKFALEIEGYRVELMGHAEALLDREFPEARVCVVTDLHLPGLLGIDALEILRRRGVAAPAILMTTQPTEKLRARARKVRALLLEKPILGNQLADAIRDLCRD